MITSQSSLSIVEQCRLLQVSRNTYYRSRAAQPIDKDAPLKYALTELYEHYPFYGKRRMCVALQNAGWKVGVWRVQRVMKEMGLKAIQSKPSTSTPHKQQPIYPYLLRGQAVTESNQVWAADITYIPMARGHLYLVAVMDWHSRRILAWRLSNTMDTRFCEEALQEALDHFGTPVIFNTDQGSQFTSAAFVKILREHGIQISMDGKGAWRDNARMERVWRSLKGECVLLNAFETPREAQTKIRQWIHFYNHNRPHQALDYRYPAEVYEADLKNVKHDG